MPHRLPGLALAAAALIVLSRAGAGEAASPSLRVLRIKAVADEAFREQTDWSDEIREHVAWADETLREVAGIGLDLVAVAPWTTHQGASMALLLDELRTGVGKDGAEVVIGFTGHPPPATMAFLGSDAGRYPMPFSAGIAFSLGDRAVVRRTEWTELTRHTLIHEIAHLFGGLHVDERSILETDMHRMSLTLDPFNRRVLDLTRGRDFDRSVREMPREELASLIDLYRQAPLRAERDADTAIRIGYLLLLTGEIEDALSELRRAVEIAAEPSRDVLKHAILPEIEAWAAEREPTVETRYLLARAYSLAERWRDASAVLEPSCGDLTEDPPSCALLGQAYLESGEPGPAERALRTALRGDDSLAVAHRALGRVLAAAGRYGEALASFGRAQELDPGDVDTLFDTGLAYLAAGNPGAAEASFREVLRRRSADDDARAKLALALARQGRSKDVRALVAPYDERLSASPSLLRDLAEAYFLAGDTQRAFEKLQLARKEGIDVQAVEALFREGAPHLGDARVGDLVEQAAAYCRTGRYDTARELLRRALDEKPREPRVHYWLGRVAVAEKDEEQARSHFERSLELDPRFLASRYELGRLAYGGEDFAAAASQLEPYVQSPEAGSAAHYMLGRSYFELGNLREAEEHLRTAIRKRPADGDSFYFLARVLLEEGRDLEARRELELAVETHSLPAFRREDAHLRLARLLAAAGESETANDHIGIALRLGAGKAKGADDDSAPLRSDRVELVSVTPTLTKALPRGQEVRIVSTVRFDLRSAERGVLLLAPQDESGHTLVRPQPRAVVPRGRGEVTLEALITTPTTGTFVEVFVALHAAGSRTTTAVARARFALE